MCGIAGMVHLNGGQITAEDRDDLEVAGARLSHRGPDGQDVSCWGGVGIAFRRLAVFDVAGGRQPLWNEDRTVGLVVNGTIYNHLGLRSRLSPAHAFRTRSDCEPMVHLYEEHGHRFVEHLDGMFAFALWDLRRGRLVLGRDRLGLKPLYYARIGNRLVFGSEIKALLAFRGCPRDVAWWETLADPSATYAMTLDDESVVSGFRGIEQVPGGVTLEIDLQTGRIEERRYWQLPSPNADMGAQEAFESYEDLLGDAIDCCLTGEAELGLTLSGGVDSALIAARAARSRRLRTFTVVSDATRGNGDAGGAFDIARRLDLPLTGVLCDEAEILGDGASWKQMVWRCETALCGPEQLLKNRALEVAKATVPGLKVMMSGLGGDEFAGGYMSTFTTAEGATWDGFMRVIGEAATREHRRHPTVASWDRLVGRPLLVPPRAAVPDDVHAAFQRRKQRDLLMYNLWCEDRLASAHSIEARAPYLDHRLVELLAEVPAGIRADVLSDKRIIRRAGRSLLADSVLQRPKVPFFHGPSERATYMPFLDLMAADGFAFLEEAITQSGARDVVDMTVARDLVNDLRESHRNPAVPTEMLLKVVNLGFLEQFASSGGPHERVEGSGMPRFEVADWRNVEAAAAAEESVKPRESTDWNAATLVFAEGATLMRTVGVTPRTYLVTEGRLRFEVLPSDPWLQVLESLDGTTPLTKICAEVATTVGAVESYVDLSVERGILQVAPCVASAPAVDRITAGAAGPA